MSDDPAYATFLAQQDYDQAMGHLEGADREREWLMARVEVLTELVRDLTDPDDCWFDHHGDCQAHAWFDTNIRPCPHGRAKELLK